MSIEADIKRSTTEEFFAVYHSEWHTIRDVAEYLGTNIQATRYYVYRLEDRGLLETRTFKVAGRDGIKRTAKQYKKITLHHF